MISDFNGVGGTTAFHLTGPIGAGGLVTFNPTSLAFGSVAVGSASAVSNVQLSNTGTDPLTFTSITLTGPNPGDFVLAVPTVGTDCRTLTTLVTGANCNIGVKFQPASTGVKSASLGVANDAAGSPQSVSLTGTGVTPPTATLSATSSAFGNQRVDTTSAAQNLTLTNNGGTPLNLTSITISGAQAADFAFAAGNTCPTGDRKSTRLNSSHVRISYAAVCFD